jgi:8-oxo-dGTP pyrophosphatase MutT (NUDIX family)
MRTNEAIVAVRRGADVLIVHRSPENTPGWHLVSGGVENGETAAEAAVRELWEETQLETTVKPLGFSFTHDGIHVDAFTADVPADWEPVLDWEHDDYRWLPPSEAVKILRWPEPREIMGLLE